jgi:hypothetical protein
MAWRFSLFSWFCLHRRIDMERMLTNLACPTAPYTKPLPWHRVSALREGLRVRRRGLHLGTDDEGQPVYLSQKHLRTHIHLLAPTGQGKSRLLLWLFELMCYTNRPIILADFKGGLYRMARDFGLTNGFAKRLVLFDLSADTVPGYNPLRENRLRLDLQAQWVAEGVKSAWGQATFDQTPQLARFLYLVLFVSRALKLSLVQGLDVLRPYPALRERALMQITDPFVHAALLAFDQLSDRRKEEMAASTLSRLEAFCRDEIIRRVICSPQSLDLESVLTERWILLLNFAKYQPLLPDPLKLLARLFTSDLLAHVYKLHGEGKLNEHNPVYFMVDEVQNMATRQLCDALDEGRGIGLNCIISNKHMTQLANADESGYLYESVMTDCRTKILGGGLDYSDLEVFANNLLLQYYNPRAIKHIQRTPVFAPIESRRAVPTLNKSNAYNKSITESFTEADSVSHSVQHSLSRGRSIADNLAYTEGEQESYSRGRNSSSTDSHNWGTSEAHSTSRTRSQAHTDGSAVGHSRGHGRSRSDGSTDSSGTSSASGWSRGEGTHTATSASEGQTMLPPEERLFEFLQEDPVVLTTSAHTGTSEGRSSSTGTNGMIGSSASHARSHIVSDSNNESDSTTRSSANTVSLSESEGWTSGSNEGYGTAHTEGESEAWTSGTNRSTTRGISVTNSEQVSDGYSDTVGHTDTRGIAFNDGETITHGESVTMSPFYEYRREEIETPVFLTPEEQKLLVMQRLSRIRKMHFLVQAPESNDCIIRAPYVGDPTITERRLAAGLQIVHAALPCYITLEQQGHSADGVRDHGNDDVVDVEVRAVSEMRTPHHALALPSPAPVDKPADAETEAELWKRWTTMSRGAHKKI